jgi:hypothetical protein
LFGKLKNPIGLFQVPLKTFNHLDYLWAKDARQLVYEKVLELMRKSSKQVQARLPHDYAKLKERLGPGGENLVTQLREQQAQLVTLYGTISHRLAPSYDYLLKHLRQVYTSIHTSLSFTSIKNK